MRFEPTNRRIRAVHENAEAGNKIAFLPRCPLPMVLMPVVESDRYGFVGEVNSEDFARLVSQHWARMERQSLAGWLGR